MVTSKVAEKRAMPVVRNEGCRAHGAVCSTPCLSHPQISREELAERTHDLLVEAEAADPATRQRILDDVVTSHLWLAETLARRFMHRGEDFEDLLQVARIGLVEACQRFDPGQGSFVGFAVPTILAYSSGTSVIMVGWYARRGQPKNSPQSSGGNGQPWCNRWARCPERRSRRGAGRASWRGAAGPLR